MKNLTEYIVENKSLEQVRYEDLNDVEADIFLTIENTKALWERYATLMRTAQKHRDRGNFDFKKLAESSAFAKIILDGVKEVERCGSKRIGRLSKETKARIAAVLIDRWED